MMIDISFLNENQKEAVLANDQFIRIVAGAGSGKTRVLTMRIAHLIQDLNIYPNKILAITFTNKAANEMKKRIQNILHDENSACFISTIHSLCVRILREDITSMNYPRNFTVLDADDQKSIIKEAYRELNIDKNKFSTSSLLDYISNNKSAYISVDRALEMAGAYSGEKTKAEVYKFYENRLHQLYALDFDDLLLWTVKMFKKFPEILNKWMNRFHYIHVDEFQDVDHVQYELIRLLVGTVNYLYVVGDPDQTIYGFRGSQADCFEQFQRLYPQAARIGLTENYRSTSEILSCAQAFLSESRSPRLHTQRTLNLPVRLQETDGPLAEGIYIAEEIDRLVGGIDMIKAHSNKRSGRQTRSLSDIAVLYRTHKQAEQIAYCLDTAGIPYTISGREDFLEDDQVHLCLSFFRTLIDKEDAISRLICNKALGEVRLQELQDQFALRTKKEKAAALISSWIDGNFLGENQAMEKLLHTAVLCPKISDLLANVASGKEADIVRSGSKEYVPEAVSLMTLHGAKGLEYPIVFVAGLKEGVLPFHIQGLTADEDEEKRLFFVGMTRAKDELILVSRPEQSSFLRLIPEEMLVKEAAEHRMPKAKQLSLFE